MLRSAPLSKRKATAPPAVRTAKVNSISWTSRPKTRRRRIGTRIRSPAMAASQKGSHRSGLNRALWVAEVMHFRPFTNLLGKLVELFENVRIPVGMRQDLAREPTVPPPTHVGVDISDELVGEVELQLNIGPDAV